MTERELSPEEQAISRIIVENEDRTSETGQIVKSLLLDYASQKVEEWPEFEALIRDPTSNKKRISEKGVIIDKGGTGKDITWKFNPVLDDSVVLTSEGLFVIPTDTYLFGSYTIRTFPMWEDKREATPENYLKYAIKALEAVNSLQPNKVTSNSSVVHFL